MRSQAVAWRLATPAQSLQIGQGKTPLTDISSLENDGGNTKDNAVVIAVSTTQFRLINGDQFGNKHHHSRG